MRHVIGQRKPRLPATGGTNLGRPRGTGNKDIPEGLYPPSGKNPCWRAKHPTSGKVFSLGTKNKAEAKAVFQQLKDDNHDQIVQMAADKLIARRNRLPGDQVLFTTYAEAYRTEILPTAAKLKDGKPMAERTREDYDKMLRLDITRSDELARPLQTIDEMVIRRYLARWLEKPTTYNHQMAVLSRVFRQAVDEGKIRRNPMRDIDRRMTARREAYITDEDYTRIIDGFRRLEQGDNNPLSAPAEFYIRVTDYLYFLSHRPANCLQLRDDNFIFYSQPVEAEDGTRIYGEAAFTAGKNDQDMIIDMNEDLAATVRWLMAYKSNQGIISKHLVVYGTGFKRQYIGKPMSRDHFARTFSLAADAAGIAKGTYTPKDLRPKALSDEFKQAGDSEKGGHKTQAMKDYYRRLRIPKRARNNLVTLR